MIAIINYGAGNLYSISKALEGLGARVKITSNPDIVKSAGAVVLPGVGAFDSAIKNLNRLGLVATIRKVIEEGKPFLGICLGMQLLFTESEEGKCKGLNIIKGRVRRFKNVEKIPHMGWNQVEPEKEMPIWKGLPGPAWMYFVHSYYPEPEELGIVAATTEYGVKFASVIWRDNVFATQFHPEKSHRDGLQILKNFIRLI